MSSLRRESVRKASREYVCDREDCDRSIRAGEQYIHRVTRKGREFQAQRLHASCARWEDGNVEGLCQ